MQQVENSLLADIREVNLSYLLLAQRMLRDDYAASMFRVGFSNEVADILMRLSPAQLVKLASSSSLLCRFRFDDYSLLSALTHDVLGGALQRMRRSCWRNSRSKSWPDGLSGSHTDNQSWPSRAFRRKPTTFCLPAR